MNLRNSELKDVAKWGRESFKAPMNLRNSERHFGDDVVVVAFQGANEPAQL